MQHVHASTLLIVFTLLAGCASSIDQDLSFRSDPQFVVTYYDRNGDGSVDFAFYHIAECTRGFDSLHPLSFLHSILGVGRSAFSVSY
jgi:hypothetical protein